MIDQPLRRCSGESYQVCPSWFDEWLDGNKVNQDNESGIGNHAEVGGTAEPTHDLSDPLDFTPFLPSNLHGSGPTLA
eukprot:1694957-Karenia_brevis.AAC.1